jgi:ribosomal protein S9
MKLRIKRVKKYRCCLQGWFESAGFLTREKRNKENRKLMRERYMSGYFEQFKEKK